MMDQRQKTIDDLVVESERLTEEANALLAKARFWLRAAIICVTISAVSLMAKWFFTE